MGDMTGSPSVGSSKYVSWLKIRERVDEDHLGILGSKYVSWLKIHELGILCILGRMHGNDILKLSSRWLFLQIEDHYYLLFLI